MSILSYWQLYHLIIQFGLALHPFFNQNFRLSGKILPTDILDILRHVYRTITHNTYTTLKKSFYTHTHIYTYTYTYTYHIYILYTYMYIYFIVYTSSTEQGGGGSFRGNLWERLVVVNHGWQSESTD